MVWGGAIDDLATTDIQTTIKMALKDSNLVNLQDGDYQDLERGLLSASNHQPNNNKDTKNSSKDLQDVPHVFGDFPT